MTFRKFRNDSERKAFLNDYTNRANGWQLWRTETIIERRWWRFDLTDDISIIVEEELKTFAYPERTEKWTPIQWYITDQKIAEYQCGDRTPHFGDYRSSKTVALAYLKACEKGEL